MKMLILLCLLLVLSLQSTLGQSSEISGVWLNGANDTITLSYNENASVGKGMALKLPIVGNTFNYSFKVIEPTYISLNDGKNYIDGVIESGDRIKITANFADTLRAIKFQGDGKE